MGKWTGAIAALAVGMMLVVPSPAAALAPARDGRHDFDFNVGTWRTRLVRLRAPLSRSRDTITLTGTVTIKPLWDGEGLYEEIEADGPDGHWRGMTFFLYNKGSGQWSQAFAGASGRLQPPMFGRFEGGRGELVAHDTVEGRAMLVRGTWSGIKPDSHRYEESLSDDGGRAWQTVITADLTRTAPVAAAAFPAAADGSHDFDFDHGSWRTRSSRLVEPLTGSTRWVELNGTTRVTPIWGGRANVAEFAADGPTGRIELISLRLFDPVARQWSLNFSTRGSGTWSVPMVGRFEGGRGTFYDQEEYRGRMVLVRFTFISLSPDEARSEQAFSDDGGKTWETNWINRYERITGEAK